MNRRNFLSSLAALPLIGLIKPTSAISPRPRLGVKLGTKDFPELVLARDNYSWYRPGDWCICRGPGIGTECLMSRQVVGRYCDYDVQDQNSILLLRVDRGPIVGFRMPEMMDRSLSWRAAKGKLQLNDRLVLVNYGSGAVYAYHLDG